MAINRIWHATHKMPKNPTIDDRILWHVDHAQHCSCRPIPKKLAEKIDEFLKKIS